MQNKSVCILLCDPWFEEKTALDGFERRDDWKISFRPGHNGDIEEITDLTRWVRRVKHDRAFHDFDFGMTLEMIDEIRTCGRPLLPYERMAKECWAAFAGCLGRRVKSQWRMTNGEGRGQGRIILILILILKNKN